MVANHWFDDGMVTIHRSGLVAGVGNGMHINIYTSSRCLFHESSHLGFYDAVTNNFPYCQTWVSMFYINSKGKRFRHSVRQSDPSCQQKLLLPWPGGCRCHLCQPNPFGRRFVFDDSRQLEWAGIKQWGPSSFCYITRVNWLRKSVAQVCPRWHNN